MRKDEKRKPMYARFPAILVLAAVVLLSGACADQDSTPDMMGEVDREVSEFVAETADDRGTDERYDAGDIQMINRLIEQNGVPGDLEHPESWSYISWSEDNPKRVIAIDLNWELPTHGEMDLMELHE